MGRNTAENGGGTWAPTETHTWKGLAKSELLRVASQNKPDPSEGPSPLLLCKLHVRPLVHTSTATNTEHERDRERETLLNKGVTHCRNAGVCDLRYFFAQGHLATAHRLILHRPSRQHQPTGKQNIPARKNQNKNFPFVRGL